MSATATITNSSPSGIPSTDEAATVERLRQGDERAFEWLVREFGGRMLATARRFLHCDEEAADAVQEAFISAFRRIDTFDGDSRVSTWLHRIVVNACLMRLRCRSRKPTVSIEECLPQFSSTGHHVQRVSRWSEEAADPATHASAVEVRQLIRDQIERLPESYREVLLLRDLEQLSTEETAEVLGESTANVKTRLHRARQSLRTLLEPIFGNGRP
jgi:RNA polymerase sigma-70 factor (ECF subfamily)